MQSIPHQNRLIPFRSPFFVAVALLLCGLVNLSCTTTNQDYCKSGIIGVDGSCNPYRLEVMSFDPKLDELKPLGMYPFAGFAISENLIIGELRTGWLGAQSLRTKNVAWWLKLNSEVASPLQIFGSWAVVGLRDGRVIKIDTTNGKVIWELDIGRFYNREATLTGSVLLVQSVDNKLFAIDFVRGRKIWVYDAGAPDQLSMRGGAKPVVVGRHAFMGTSHGDVQIINFENGQLLRKINLPLGGFRFKDVMGDIIVQQDHVLFAKYDGEVGKIAYNTPSPLVKWNRTFSSIATTTYREGIYYVGCTNGDLYAIDFGTGKDLWKFSTGQTIIAVTSSEKSLFVTGSMGQISSVDAANGSLEWMDHLDGTVSDRPLILGDRIYFATGLQTLYGYKIR